MSTTRPGLEWRPLRLLSSIRFDEVCVLQGTPLIGALFSVGALTPHTAFMLAALLVGSFALVAHVFVLNDWAGIHGDLRDPARASRTFIDKGVSRSELGYLAAALLALALLVFWFIGTTAFVVGLSLAVASALYSAPSFHMKGTPVLGSALHLLGGVLHFLLGYAAFATIDERAVAIGCFFGLAFTAGHLMHEARGYEGDNLNGIRTNAVAFGKKRSFMAGLALFTAAYALLAVLAAVGLVPRILVMAALLYPLHLRMSLRALRSGLTSESLSRLQTAYRALYAVIGVTMVIALWR